MKICITSRGDTLDSLVDSRFGRCEYFIIYDIDGSEFEAVKNGMAQTAGGAGIQSGQIMADKGIKALLTGNVGPNAFQVLKAADIEIFTGVSGKISDAIKMFNNGELSSVKDASVSSHFGLNKE